VVSLEKAESWCDELVACFVCLTPLCHTCGIIGKGRVMIWWVSCLFCLFDTSCHTCVVSLENPCWVGVPWVKFIIFQSMVKKLLNTEQFFH
jgi:hypothetical protein